MKVRHTFLDVYRGVIVLCMVEGHVVRELLRPVLQDSEVFRFHELLHGVVGPGFLFGAGLTFGISAQRHWKDFLSLSPRFLRRLRKILLLFCLGYILHLPFFSFSKMFLKATASDWTFFFSFDVLQCIGLSLLLLHVLMLVVRREQFFVFSTIMILIGLVYAAPHLWRTEITGGLPPFLVSALQGTGGSAYPLFPYGAFLLAGALVSYEFMRFSEVGREAMFVRRLVLMGIAVFAVAFIVDALPFHTYQSYDFWLASPNFFLMKLGCLFILVAGIWILEHTAFDERLSVKHDWLVLFGVESLFVYVVHLILLYGWILNPDLNLSFKWAGTLNWSSSLGFSLGLMAFLYGLARVWNFLKEDHPVLYKGVVWWLGGTFVVEFLTRSY